MSGRWSGHGEAKQPKKVLDGELHVEVEHKGLAERVTGACCSQVDAETGAIPEAGLPRTGSGSRSREMKERRKERDLDRKSTV